MAVQNGSDAIINAFILTSTSLNHIALAKSVSGYLGKMFVFY